jgi:hypothetical protein
MAGNTKHCYNKWTNITRDPWVLESIANFKIPLIQVPIQGIWHPTSFSEVEAKLINEEINKLLHLGVIEKCDVILHQIKLYQTFLQGKRNLVGYVLFLI